MPDWKHVRRFALSLPGTREKDSHGHAQWCVGDKSFAWERPLRPSDLEALGKKAPTGPVLALRTAHLLSKEAILGANPKTCFTTPHFDGYPAVLVRLDKIDAGSLEHLMIEAWLARAPKRLAKEYLETHRS